MSDRGKNSRQLAVVRSVAAAVIVAAVATASNWMFISVTGNQLDAARRNNPNGDPGWSYTAFELRFAALAGKLPGKGPVGYVTDMAPNETRSYYMARYFLSPVRLARQVPCDVAIGDFYGNNPRLREFVLAREGYTVTQDLGSGLLILVRKGKAP